MPIYYSIKDGQPEPHGLLDSDFQYVESISLPKALGKPIPTNRADIGDFIFSDSFKPCNAVVARLTNGQFAIYHAQVGHRFATGFIELINKIQGKVKDIFVFQKTLPRDDQVNIEKARTLAIELSIALGMKVPRVHIDNYSAVIADAKHNKIILIKNIFYMGQKKDKYLDISSEVKPIDITKVISYDESVDEFKKLPKYMQLDIKIPETLKAPIVASGDKMKEVKEVKIVSMPSSPIIVKSMESKASKDTANEMQELENEINLQIAQITTIKNKLFYRTWMNEQIAILRICLEHIRMKEPNDKVFNEKLQNFRNRSRNCEAIINKSLSFMRKLALTQHTLKLDR